MMTQILLVRTDPVWNSYLGINTANRTMASKSFKEEHPLGKE